LKRVGATIVKEKLGDAEATYYLRVDPDQGAKWVDAVSAFLTGSSGKPYSADISKYFYASQGSVRYLWRIVLSGDVNSALTLFGACAVQAAMAHAPEITSIPLVGRIRYPYDPARGKIKGAHEVDTAMGVIGAAAAGFGGGAS
jgi:hypothetical protein